MSALRQLLRGERGQTSIEYLGLAAVVVAIIGAILVGAPSIGDAIVDGIKDQIEAIL